MRQPLLLCSSAIVIALFAPSALAATWYVSPTGTGTSAASCATRDTPCTLASSASGAVAGDTVVLMDGVYKSPLYITVTGTSAAWITFKADDCATPIIEGAGPGPMVDDQSSGVGSSVANYVRFQGLVVRGWNIGFGNGWAGGTSSEELSNGHWEIENCISYGNGRTGFTFFSAEGFSLKNSISAHNGSSQVHSWSSGVTLFEASGAGNKVEGTISFENTDAERHTDGSGFIVDEESNNATFINNVGFGNAGSCFRLTRSSGTRFINNTCYHNSQFGSQATGPTNPGEIYFTNGGVTQQNVSFMNNVVVGTGQAPAGSTPIQNQPSSGWSNNVVTTGAVTFFTDADGTNPNFVPVAGATSLVGKGAAGAGVPTTDIGFDPKCLVKRKPVLVGAVAVESWWQYDIDIDYIKSIGGVAKCFNGGARTGMPDIGAYKTGAVTTVAAGSCVPPMVGTGGGGAGGAGSTGGAGGVASGGTTNGAAGSSAGGVAVGGAGGTSGAFGGTASNGGSASAGDGSSTAGSAPSGTGATGASSGSTSPGGSGSPAANDGGCNCRIAPKQSGFPSLIGLGLLGLATVGLVRRRHARSAGI